MNDDLDARTKQLAKDLLQALDREDDPDRLAYAVQKEREHSSNGLKLILT